MVFATLAICIISFMVWLHHFFTMGAGADVNAVFGIASMVIAVPTGVKIFNWLFTMYGGRVRFSVADALRDRLHPDLRDRRPDRRAAGDSAGGLRLHNSLFLVAHFHHVIIGGVVFASDGRLHLLVPESVRLHARRAARQGRLLVLVHRLLSRLHAAATCSAYGARRGGCSTIADPSWQPWMIVALIGARSIIGLGSC